MLFFSTQINFNRLKHVDVHSNKFIRLARNAKLANLSFFFKHFTFFKKNLGYQLSNNYPTNLLLFLNQGLSTQELNKLRFNLNSLGITFTQFPTRFWSNSFIYSNNNPVSLSNYVNKNIDKKKLVKKTLYGNILGLYIHKNSSSSFNKNPFYEPTYLIYQFIQNSLINNQKNKSYFVKNNELNVFNLLEQNSFHSNRLILPWDLLASQVIDNKELDLNNTFIFNSWFQETNNDNVLNHVNLLLNYLTTYRLTFAGLLNVKQSKDSLLFFDNIDLLNDSSLDLKKSNTFFCFESLNFNCLNKQYIVYI